ncbi:unnamed protein product [Acidithrix sp. C25]|nr:unnamed protein product [Acidithrix sp. C25]
MLCDSISYVFLLSMRRAALICRSAFSYPPNRPGLEGVDV